MCGLRTSKGELLILACHGIEGSDGDWSAKHVALIALKKHGRPEHSVFAHGLMLLGDLLHGFAINLRRVSLIAFGILRAAVAAEEK